MSEETRLLAEVYRQQIGPTFQRVDRMRNARAFAAAKTRGESAEFLAVYRAERRRWLIWLTTTQRDWQTKVSRRPQRGRHHDSWAIRERYMRG